MLQDTLAKWHTSHSSCFQRIYGDGSECCSPALKELYAICILRRSIKVIFILPLLLREISSYQFLLGLEIRKYHFIFWPFKYSHCVNGRVPYLRHLCSLGRTVDLVDRRDCLLGLFLLFSHLHQGGKIWKSSS